MAVTTVIKSIGTASRDYSTIASWESAKPTDFTTTRAAITVTGSTSSTIVLDALASAVTDFYAGHAVYCDARPAEKRLITAYNGTTKVATIGVLNGSSATWDNTPGTEAFTIDATIWEGQSYNDAEFSSATITIAGSTTSSTAYAHLTTAAGQSFQDHANVRTNALTYNQSLGVGISRSGTYGYLIDCPGPENFPRLSKLQLKTGTNGGGINFSASSCIAKDVLVFGTRGASNLVLGVTATFINVLVILTGTAADAFSLQTTSKAIGCTAVRQSNQTAAGTGFVTSGANNIIQSCTSFGFSTCASASGWDTTNSKFNATEQASGLPGSSNQHSVTYSNVTPFTDADNSGTDLRSIAATTLAANGFLDASLAPNDISGFARSATPTIGHWELASAAAARRSRLPLMGVG